MIAVQGKTNIVEIHYGGKNIVAKYYGLRLVWEQAKSCYGTGIWLPERPWLENDKWKDNR